MRGEGRVFQRGQIWWIAYYDNGRELRESARSRHRKDALRLLRQRVGEAVVVTPDPTASRRSGVPAATMQDLFDLLEDNYRLHNRTSKANYVALRRLRKRFSEYRVEACTGMAISHYMAAMQRQGRKPETINREMNVLRRALRLGYQHDLVQRVPAIQRLPELGVRNEFFTRDEVNRLLPHLPEYLRDVVLFAYLTGWRKGEIISLRWSNVSRSGGVIRLDPEQNKGRDVRVLVLQGELAALIERRWKQRKVGQALATHVFHCDGFRIGKFWEVWLRACRDAGLGHRWFHSLRRSAARWMSLEGIPEKVIMSIMGHKTRGMFDRYNIVTESDQRAYAKRLFGP